MTKYDQTTVNLPPDTKRMVRLVAANMGISMGRAALKLIELGLQEIEEVGQPNRVPESRPTQLAGESTVVRGGCNGRNQLNGLCL
jgi:hypothetical protein